MMGPGRRSRPHAAAAALAVLLALGSELVRGQQPTPEPRPSPSSPPSPAGSASPSPLPSPSPAGRLRLDVGGEVEKMLAAKEASGLPRFETSVEVIGKTPQVMIERFFRPLDLECGPAAAGPPSEAETRAFRPHTSPYIDFAALARWLASKRGTTGKARYFLYRVRQRGSVSYSLREEPLSDTMFYNSPGATFELVETFGDLKLAAEAWRRMERGFDRPVPDASSSPPPPWVTYPCRPRFQ